MKQTYIFSITAATRSPNLPDAQNQPPAEKMCQNGLK